MKNTPKNIGHRLRKPAALALAGGLLWALTGGSVLAEEPSGWVDTFDNAAFDYWRAAALMQSPAGPDKLALLEFAEDVLPYVEPRVLALNADAARWLLADRPMLAALNEGGSRNYCFFHPPGPGGGGGTTHHRAVADLTRRALAMASAFEFVENERATAGTYVDVLRMVGRLDEDLLWVSAYQHLRLLPQVVSAVEGFCSREPPRQAVGPLADYLAGLERPCFPQAIYLKREMETYRHWLLEDPGQARERLGKMYGQAALQPAVDKLSTLPLKERTERLSTWFTEYRAEMDKLVDWVEQPHDEALKGISAMDKQVAKLAEDPSEEGVNPLLPLLMRPFAQTYEQFLAAEAAYTMMDIVTAATVHKDFTGRWPTSLDELEGFTGRTFPLDPFTGKPHEYHLSGKMPEVSAKLPGWLKRQSNLPAELVLKDRLEHDAKALDQHAKVVKAERLRAAMKEQGEQKARR